MPDHAVQWDEERETWECACGFETSEDDTARNHVQGTGA